MAKSSFDQFHTIQPGEPWVIHPRYDRFYVVSSPVPLLIKHDDTAEKYYPAGTGENFLQEFGRMEIRHESPAPVLVRIWAGYGDFVDNRHFLLDQPCELVAWPLAGGLIAPAQEVTLPGTPYGFRQQRRAVNVSNLDAALRLELLDAAGNVALLIHPGTSITIPAASAVKVKNPTGQSIAAAISEIWYLAQ